MEALLGSLDRDNHDSSLKGVDARVVAAVDFGTTFSGFAFAHRQSPGEVHKFYEWEGAGEANAVAYCKTQTSLYYTRAADGRLQLKDWGWPAFVSFTHDSKNQARAARKKPAAAFEGGLDLENQGAGHFLTKFKLHLAGDANIGNSAAGFSTEQLPLPEGLTVDTAITDFLTNISGFIIKQLQQKYGAQFTVKEVQWCLTVPAIWNDKAKQKMKVYAEKAGMVQGRYTPKGVQASPHKMMICLEPEAASFYCLLVSKDVSFQQGDQYMIADIGGGTVDIVVHQKSSKDGEEIEVKEVVASYGGLCGGAYADQSFQTFLKHKVGCYEAYSVDKVSLQLEMQKNWELGKRSYNGKLKSSLAFSFPAGLATAWEEYDKSKGLEARESYDELELSNEDMKQILDPVVNQIIELIKKELSDKVKTIMVVGGFSASPYLMDRICQEFSDKVQKIVNPPDPGAAICHGAVLMGLGTDKGILSRISRKTYGLSTARRARRGDPPEKRYFDEDGSEQCKEVFSPYVFSGTELAVNEKVSKVFQPSKRDQRSISIQVYSTSSEIDPDYVTDERVALDGSYDMDISDGLDKGKDRNIEVSMFFGKSAIEIQGKRQNFGDITKIENFFLDFGA